MLGQVVQYTELERASGNIEGVEEPPHSSPIPQLLHLEHKFSSVKGHFEDEMKGDAGIPI